MAMLFAVRFTDTPDCRSIRQQNLADHLAWLSRHERQILVAGSLREAPDSNPAAGLWMVEADSKQAVENLNRNDPFWTAGLRAGVGILHWSRAFPDKQVPV